MNEKNWNPIEYAKKALRRSARKTRGWNIAINRTKYTVWPTNKNGTKSKKYECRWVCESCGKRDLKDKQKQLDHIIPLGLSPTLEDWIRNVYCDESGYQTLCLPCHKTKTAQDIKDIKEFKKRDKVFQE